MDDDDGQADGRPSCPLCRWRSDKEDDDEVRWGKKDRCSKVKKEGGHREKVVVLYGGRGDSLKKKTVHMIKNRKH